jgi:hypothetical protein
MNVFDTFFPMMATRQMELDAIREEIETNAANGIYNFTIDLDRYPDVTVEDIENMFS